MHPFLAAVPDYNAAVSLERLTYIFVLFVSFVVKFFVRFV